MMEVFDLIAGSETGAIIATSLALKNTDATTSKTQPNMFFADKSQQFFEEYTDKFYQDSKMPIIVRILLSAFLLGVVGTYVYFGCQKLHEVPNFDLTVDQLQAYIKLSKKEVKKGFFDEKYKSKLNSELEKVHKEFYG